MLLSIGIITLSGMFLGWLSKKIKLPSLVGMLLAGIIAGPYVLNIIDPTVLNISAEIRKIALIIILTRAGLSLDINGLKKIGRPAVLMCFVPATFELLGIIILGPPLLGMTRMEAAVTGAVLSAVSPAVVVPRMVKLMEEGYGADKKIPELILAGASVDDVYVIVLFTTFTGMMQGSEVSIIKFINIPFSIASGVLAGTLAGIVLSLFFKKVKIRDTAKVLIVLSISFILSFCEDNMNTPLTFSSLIAIMFIGSTIKKKSKETSENLSSKYNKLWVGAEIFLFVLVGTQVNISYIKKAGILTLILIIGALVFRMTGVFICLIKTGLNIKEKLFTMLAYCPKATVQAAIGGIPLSLGLSCGTGTLTCAVLAIILTAPLGAFAIDLSYKKLLNKS